MENTKKKLWLVNVIISALVLFAFSLRFFDFNNISKDFENAYRTIVYFSLVTFWGLSLRSRIIQKHTRRSLTAVSSTMAFWLIVRTIKYYFVENPVIIRYLWYLFYIPFLYIPLFSFFTSLSLRKNEDYVIPKKFNLLYIPTTLLVLLVLTNDCHQLVFKFNDTLWTEYNCSYFIGCYICAAWIIILAIFTVSNIIRKCRIPISKKLIVLPIIPLVLIFAYCICYVIDLSFIKLIAGDICVAVCVLVISLFECCIQIGLIQSNTDYGLLFYTTDINAQITDENLNIMYSTKNLYEKDIVHKNNPESVELDLSESNTVVKRSKLKKGYIFWQEDITELKNVIDELEIIRDELHDMGDILKAENEQRAYWLKISEENRLYDKIEKQTADYVATLRDLIGKLKVCEDIEQAKRYLGKIVLIGTYIKRKSNLVFVESRQSTIDTEELKLCLNESSTNLRLYGVISKTTLDLKGQLSAYCANRIYDIFEAVIDESADSLSSLLLYAKGEHLIEVSICAECESDFSNLTKKYPDVNVALDDDLISYITFKIERQAISDEHN